MAIIARTADAQHESDPSAESDQYVTHVYNIADLLDAPSMLDENSRPSTIQGGTSGFGGGGGGGGLGGGGGGGGMFVIPDNILPQFGGGGGGGMLQLPDRMTRETLQSVIEVHLAHSEIMWQSISGEGGAFTFVSSMLIVTHTSAVHDKIKQLLAALRTGNNAGLTVQVDLRIIEIAADQSVSLLTSDAKSLGILADHASAAQLSLRCDNHQVASVSSGLRRSYIVSLTPVVGDNVGVDAPQTSSRGIGYMPVTEDHLLGLYGKIKPEIADDQKSGRIHLGIELASGPEEVRSTVFAMGLSLDRMEIELARLETSVAANSGTWTLAGNIAVCDPTLGITSGAALPHLAVLVRWSLTD